MCSIIGYVGEFDKELINKIFFNSRIRGLHAFGFSYYQDNQLKTNKYLTYKDFVDDIFAIKPNMFIAHFRYSTSGDYKILENNQPIQLNNKSIAFNGVISQKNKSEMEFEYDLILPEENDGYILINKYNDKNFVYKKNISFAMVGLENKKLFAIRNDKRPLHIYKGNNKQIICSTKDILNRSGLKETNEITEFQILEI